MKKFLALLLCTMALEAGSVNLVNDSPYRLRVVIRATDGTFLGEMVIPAQNTAVWTDGYRGLPGSLNSVRSQTPYQVLWYCLDGSPFSTTSLVATGTTVTANNGDGAKECRGKGKKEEEERVQPAPSVTVPGETEPSQNSSQQPWPPPYPTPQEEYQNPEYQGELVEPPNSGNRSEQ